MNTKKEIIEAIKNTKGRIFSVNFTKKNGEPRAMTCRTGVTKHLTGAGRVYNPSDYGLVGVFEMKRNQSGYKMVNINTLSHAQIDGRSYEL